jgi:hypothetical protein
VISFGQGVSIDALGTATVVVKMGMLAASLCCVQTLSLLFNCLGAFLVEPRLKFVLQWSAFVNLRIV